MSTYTDMTNKVRMYFDKSVLDEFLTRAINYEMDYKQSLVTVTFEDTEQTQLEYLKELGIEDLEDSLVYTDYSPDLNVPRTYNEARR